MRLLQRPKQVLYTKKVKTSIYEFNTLLLGIRPGAGGGVQKEPAANNSNGS